MPRPAMMAAVSAPIVPLAMANAMKTQSHPDDSGIRTIASSDAAPTMTVVPTRYAMRSRARAAVTSRGSIESTRSTTFNGSPTIPRSVR